MWEERNSTDLESVNTLHFMCHLSNQIQYSAKECACLKILVDSIRIQHHPNVCGDFSLCFVASVVNPIFCCSWRGSISIRKLLRLVCMGNEKRFSSKGTILELLRDLVLWAKIQTLQGCIRMMNSDLRKDRQNGTALSLVGGYPQQNSTCGALTATKETAGTTHNIR